MHTVTSERSLSVTEGYLRLDNSVFNNTLMSSIQEGDAILFTKLPMPSSTAIYTIGRYSNG